MTFQNILQDKPSEVAKIANYFREKVLNLHPKIEEVIYGGAKVQIALYHIGNSNNVAIGIGPGAKHCQIFIHHFDKVNTHGLKLEGKGKHARHVKVFKIEEVEIDKFIAMFKEVISIAEKKA